MDIKAPLFSASELGKVAGVDRKLVNLWLERRVVRPTRLEQLASRRRPSFSVAAIFKARLTRVLAESLAISTSSAVIAGLAAEMADDPKSATAELRRHVRVAADPGWMQASARSVERGKPLALFAGISRTGDRWRFALEPDAGKLADRFESDAPYAVVPIGSIFESVYRDCKARYEGGSPDKPRKRARARA